MRTNKAALNSLMAITQRIIDTILSFVYRTLFIYIMGATYLGVNGLFSHIFSVLLPVPDSKRQRVPMCGQCCQCARYSPDWPS